jgi:hypothetical protein
LKAQQKRLIALQVNTVKTRVRMLRANPAPTVLLNLLHRRCATPDISAAKTQRFALSARLKAIVLLEVHLKNRVK